MYTEADIYALRLSAHVEEDVMFAVGSEADIVATSQLRTSLDARPPSSIRRRLRPILGVSRQGPDVGPPMDPTQAICFSVANIGRSLR
jgi:hypothetical protein